VFAEPHPVPALGHDASGKLRRCLDYVKRLVSLNAKMTQSYKHVADPSSCCTADNLVKIGDRWQPEVPLDEFLDPGMLPLCESGALSAGSAITTRARCALAGDPMQSRNLRLPLRTHRGDVCRRKR